MCLLCLGTVELSKGPQRIYLLQEWTLVNSVHGLLIWKGMAVGGCVKVKNAENQLCDAALRERNKRFNASGSRWHFSAPNAVWFAVSDYKKRNASYHSVFNLESLAHLHRWKGLIWNLLVEETNQRAPLHQTGADGR